MVVHLFKKKLNKVFEITISQSLLLVMEGIIVAYVIVLFRGRHVFIFILFCKNEKI